MPRAVGASAHVVVCVSRYHSIYHRVMQSRRYDRFLFSLAVVALSSACPAGSKAPMSNSPSTKTNATASTPRAQPREIDTSFLHQLASTYSFRMGTPMRITPTPDGDAVLFLRSEANSMRRDLYRFDVATGEEQVLLRAQELADSEGPLPDAEAARRQRQRMVAAGIARYRLSRDGRLILAPLSGSLYVIERATKKITKLESKAGYPIDPRMSPSASHIAYVVDDDLYVTEVSSGEQRRLTTREGDKVHNGVAEFVAQEEMDRYQGYWWSPDSASLVYQRTDTSNVQVWHIADASRPSAKPKTWPYPQAGTANADVRLGVISIRGGDTVWIDWDRAQFPYVAKVVWKENAPLTILVQNRTQTVERLLAVDTATGNTTQLLEERDDAWLNIDPSMPYWLKDGKHFLWTTERNGWWQLELRRADGALERALTEPSFPYRGIAHVRDAGDAVYVMGNAPDDATQSHVFRLSMAPGSKPEQITDGVGMHSTQFSRNGAIYVHRRIGLSGDGTIGVFRANGQEIGQITSNAAKPPFDANVELTHVQAGAHRYAALLVRPRDFDASRIYPVLVHVYGGPHSQMVTATGRRYLKNQWIADHGFIVVAIDGRGTPNRGRAWERAVKGDLSTLSLDDQVAGLRALGEKYPELDLSRVGIWGWSFGGYMAAMGVMRHPDVFHAGIAGAPVSDWHDYDTHYTERYMGMPDDNPDGYKKANVLTYADRLERPLMIIHGTGDDNVYVVHSLKLVDALLRAGKPYEFIPLLGKTHMVADPMTRLRLEQRVLEFFIRHLGSKSAVSDHEKATSSSRQHTP